MWEDFLLFSEKENSHTILNLLMINFLYLRNTEKCVDLHIWLVRIIYIVDKLIVMVIVITPAKMRRGKIFLIIHKTHKI